MRIGVDLMGSDSSPEELFAALFHVARGNSGADDSFVAFTTEKVYEMLVGIRPLHDLATVEVASRIDFHIVPEVITMEDDPLSAVRLKKNASLTIGIRELRNKKIDAFVTAGNTGALITSASLSLPRLPGSSRSALLTLLPTQGEPLAMVDVGGNVSCQENHLVQYAHFGAAYQRCTRGLDRPKVGLLNIGVESRKGTDALRGAYQALEKLSANPEAKLNFIGNVEGREVFEGVIDVLVTDGFTGNVMLKTSEGLSSFIFDHLQQDASDDLRYAVSQMQSHFSYEEYPGAIVCGVDGIVVKCHGAATKRGMIHSILGAMSLVENRLIDKIKEEL